MIVVDTNVISELMRGEPHPTVLAWMGAQPRALLFTTQINQAEILCGIAALPEGRLAAHRWLSIRYRRPGLAEGQTVLGVGWN